MDSSPPPLLPSTIDDSPISDPAPHSLPSLLITLLQITLSSSLIILLAAHASLRRPPSAAVARGKTRKHASRDHFSDGFAATDALTLPLVAAAVLVSLYYLIKWLEDPAILNRIIRAYVSAVSLAATVKAGRDGVQVGVGMVFPRVWRDGRGRVWEIWEGGRRGWRRPRLRLVRGGEGERAEESGDVTTKAMTTAREDDGAVARRSEPGPEEGASAATDEGRNNNTTKKKKDMMTTLAGHAHSPSPLLPSRLPQSIYDAAWALRRALNDSWTVRIAAHGFGRACYRMTAPDVLGALLAMAINFAYYLTGSYMLSNMLGAAMSYSVLTIISPTSFVIGTMVLWSLFAYDIIMVFYTPYMITVATKMDVPIKLVFQGPSRASMLGLGDIVVPGMFLALALRFDLYRRYQKQIKYVPVELKATTTTSTAAAATTDATDNTNTTTTTTTTVTTTHIQHRAIKVPYLDPRGRWPDLLWTLLPRSGGLPATTIPHITPALFSRPYFAAALAGYVVGMAATIVVMTMTQHGQPALLYLVPAVTGVTWATGWWRGEVGEMVAFTEDGSLDVEDVVVEIDGEGRVVGRVDVEGKDKSKDEKEMKEKKKGDEKEVKEKKVGEEERDEDGDDEDDQDDDSDSSDDRFSRPAYEMFHFSVRAPPSWGWERKTEGRKESEASRA